MKPALTILLFVSFASALSAWQTDDPSAIDDTRFRPADIFELEFASDPQISPDGTRIVYTRNFFDIMSDRRQSRLWMIDETGQHLPLVDDQNAASPRWSPDGNRLAFVTLRDEKPQIHCLWLESGRTAALSRLTESPGGLAWSPDGRQIAFTMRVPDPRQPYVEMPKKPEGAEWADAPMMITELNYRSDGRGYLKDGHTQIFVLSAQGGSPRQLTSGHFNHRGNLCWMPDSSRILFSANRNDDHELNPSNSDLYEIGVADRTLIQLTHRNGPDTGPALSRDASHLAFTGYDDQLLGHQSSVLYVMNPDGSGRRVLANIDRDIDSPVWSDHHQGFLFTYVDQGNVRLGLAELDGHVSTDLADHLGSSIGRPYAGGGQVSVADNGKIAFCVTDSGRPGDLATLVPGGTVRRLTDLNQDLLGHKSLGQVSELRFLSSAGNQEIQAWLIRPPEFDPDKKYPLILEIHGGPFAAYGDVFTGEMQLMASAGYVVLYVNPRGSTGYGEDFANLIHHNYPGQDYDDLMSAVDETIGLGFVDENRLFVTGGSGGGVLTSWIVGKTNRFRAAVVVKPVINWYSFALTADMYNYFYKYWFPGYPWEYPEEYHRRSPISLVGNVQTPTMLMTGEEDYRTPIAESEQYYQALKLREIDTALVRIPGASHGIAARPSHLIAKVAYILKWFEEHDRADSEESPSDDIPQARANFEWQASHP